MKLYNAKRCRLLANVYSHAKELCHTSLRCIGQEGVGCFFFFIFVFFCFVCFQKVLASILERSMVIAGRSALALLEGQRHAHTTPHHWLLCSQALPPSGSGHHPGLNGKLHPNLNTCESSAMSTSYFPGPFEHRSLSFSLALEEGGVQLQR